jgi:hypothetical protein
MVTLNEVGQQKQRIAERLARLDAERTKLNDQLKKLEMTERVLTRVRKKAGEPDEPRRGGSAKAKLAADGKRKAHGGRQTPSMSMGDAALKAVQAHRSGVAVNGILNYLSQKFGMSVRPNHLGAALQRHRRAGRIENRDQRWHVAPSNQRGQSKQSATTG